ncbi:MAG TPA: HAD-IB family hydrolase [Chloroflexia bacterium]|nr:HAD-IB family hydrolase [Chloroflexia bacterium]
MVNRIVFCDIEGTLVEGSLSSGFVRAGRAMHLFSPGRMLQAQFYMLLMRLLPRYAPRLRWEALLRLLAGHSAADIQRAGRAGLQDLQRQLKPNVMARLTAHQEQGDTVILLSGGPQDAATVVAEEVGAAAGEGTRPEQRNGVYTGRIGSGINHGPAKARRAATLAAARGVALADCVAYGDSAADIPLLASVGHPVAVDPDPALRAAAQARGWEILVSSGRPAPAP